jgi:TnpA family transposase
MPARLSVTKAQREALLLLPDTEEAFVRHYSLVAEDIEIISGYRTPETRLAFALQLCVLRYPGRVLRHGEIMPMPYARGPLPELFRRSDGRQSCRQRAWLRRPSARRH